MPTETAAESATPACFVCRKHRGEAELPGGPIDEDDLLYVGHVQVRDDQTTAYLGHLLVAPKRHAPGLGDLTDDEAAAVGVMGARVGEWLDAPRGGDAEIAPLCAELRGELVPGA